MYFYELDTKFRFGKHIHKTLSDVIIADPTYVLWCIMNNKLFLTTEEILKEAYKKKGNNFVLEELIKENEAKLQEYNNDNYDPWSEVDESYYDDGWGDVDPFYDAFEGDIDAWNHYRQ